VLSRFLSLLFAQLCDRHRIGLEVAVNTSFNVAGPIAQTVPQTVDTLRRSKGLDAVLIFAEEGSVFAVWHCDRPAAGASRFLQGLSSGEQKPARRPGNHKVYDGVIQ
jgi:hypothetical protein